MQAPYTIMVISDIMHEVVCWSWIGVGTWFEYERSPNLTTCSTPGGAACRVLALWPDAKMTFLTVS